MQTDIVRDAWKLAAYIERAAAKIEAAPGFGKPFKAVKAVDDAFTEARCDKTDGPARVDPELEIVTFNLRFGQCKIDQFALAVEAQRVRHFALDIVHRALKRAHRSFAHRVDPPDVEELIGPTDDLVEDIFELEICDEHGRYTLLMADRAEHVHGAERVQKRAPLDIWLDRREQPVGEARREIGKQVESPRDQSTPARLRKYIDHFPRAEAVFSGTAIAWREFEQLADKIVAVWLKHNDLVGDPCERSKHVRGSCLDVMQDADQEYAVVARQRIVVERYKVGRKKFQMSPGRGCVCARNGGGRQIIAVDFVVT